MMRGLLLILCLTVSTWNLAGADTPFVLGFRLLNLSNAEVESLEQFKGKPTLMMFFQPDCDWCFRQVRALNRLHQRCGADINLLAVGVKGSRQALKQELRRTRPAFNAYLANPRLIKSLGGEPVTPSTIEVDAKGHMVSWRQGHVPQQWLHEVFTGLPGRCAIDGGQSG